MEIKNEAKIKSLLIEKNKLYFINNLGYYQLKALFDAVNTKLWNLGYGESWEYFNSFKHSLPRLTPY